MSGLTLEFTAYIEVLHDEQIVLEEKQRRQ